MRSVILTGGTYRIAKCKKITDPLVRGLPCQRICLSSIFLVFLTPKPRKAPGPFPKTGISVSVQGSCISHTHFSGCPHGEIHGVQQ